MKIIKFIIPILLGGSSPLVLGQDCNCESNFQWVKKTFEENDAGFRCGNR